MRMRRGPERPYISRDTLERSLRMVIERGGSRSSCSTRAPGAGARFLNSVFRALFALPAAQRALPGEQVRSRFIRAAVARSLDCI